MADLMGSIDKEQRPIVREAMERGWTPELTGGGHLRMRHENPDVPLVITGTTPSDPRSVHHFRSELARAERVAEPQPPATKEQTMTEPTTDAPEPTDEPEKRTHAPRYTYDQAVLDLLAVTRRPMGNTEIAGHVGMSKGTTSSVLTRLAREGLVTKPRRGRWQIADDEPETITAEPDPAPHGPSQVVAANGDAMYAHIADLSGGRVLLEADDGNLFVATLTRLEV